MPLTWDQSPRQLDLRFVAGDDVVVPITFVELDLTGYTLTASIRRRPESSVEVEATVTVTDENGGAITVGFDKAQTASLVQGEHVWDLQWVDSGGSTRTVLSGTVEVLGDVAR